MSDKELSVTARIHKSLAKAFVGTVVTSESMTNEGFGPANNTSASLNRLFAEGRLTREATTTSNGRPTWLYKVTDKMREPRAATAKPVKHTKNHGSQSPREQPVPVVIERRTAEQIANDMLALLVEMRALAEAPLSSYSDAALLGELTRRHSAS